MCYWITPQEARFNALLELLERDAYSQFLLDSYVYGKEVLLLNHDSLAQRWQAYIDALERLSGAEVRIALVEKSRFDLVTFIVTIASKERDLLFFQSSKGYATALSPDLALQRALTEAVQSYNVIRRKGFSSFLLDQQLIKTHPLLFKTFLKTEEELSSVLQLFETRIKDLSEDLGARIEVHLER